MTETDRLQSPLALNAIAAAEREANHHILGHEGLTAEEGAACVSPAAQQKTLRRMTVGGSESRASAVTVQPASFSVRACHDRDAGGGTRSSRGENSHSWRPGAPRSSLQRHYGS